MGARAWGTRGLSSPRGIVLGATFLAILVARARAADATDVAARLGTTTISTAEIEEQGRMPLFQARVQEYEARLRVLDGLIADRLLAAEAASRQVTVDALLAAEVAAKVDPVKPEEVAAAFERVKARVAGRPEAQVKAQIERELAERRGRDRRQAFLRELRGKAGVEILLEPPRLAVDASGGVARGPQAAPVTIVEFSDFECPFCVRAAPVLKKVLATYPDKVRLVHRDMPLPIHPLAIKAAEAAACAGDQDRFWEMHDRLFAAAGKLAVADLKSYAAELGLDAPAFDACLDSGRNETRWQAGRQAAQSYGVTGTPAFFINGRFVSGARPFEVFAEIIDDELARATRAKPATASR
jgi:predicted DsbA family dithiol-disulfide isomerase